MMINKKIFGIILFIFLILVSINVDASSFKCTYKFYGRIYGSGEEAKNSRSILPFYVTFSKDDNSRIVKFSLRSDENYTVHSFLQEKHGVMTVAGIRNAVQLNSITDSFGPNFANDSLYKPMAEDCYRCPTRFYIDLSDITRDGGVFEIAEDVLIYEITGNADYIYLQSSMSEYYDATKTCEYPYNDYNLGFDITMNQDECANTAIENILEFVDTYIFTPIKWIVPIVLIILTSYDLAKAVFVKPEDAMKKVKDNFMKRALIALIIFLAPSIITLVLNLVDSVIDNQCINSDVMDEF